MGNEKPRQRRSTNRVAEVTARRLAEQRESVEREVARILAVTLGLVEKSAPAMPSVAEIVSAAGISTQTLYRYFGNKDALVFAVLEQGVDRLADKLEVRMAHFDDPILQISEWIDGVLRQIEEADAARTSRVVIGHLDKETDDQRYAGSLLAPVNELLDVPISRIGRDPAMYGPLIADLTFGVLRRHLWSGTVPSAQERAALREFVAAGIVT